MDLEVTCACGRRLVVSEFAIGMTNPCPGCGQPLTVSLKNARPVGGDVTPSPSSAPPAPEIAPVSEFSAPHQPAVRQVSGNQCARCGRTFRGDWDRYRTSEGIVCHICSNQAVSKADQSITGFIEPVESIRIDAAAVEPIPPEQRVVILEGETPWYERLIPDEQFMHKVAIAGAVVVIALGLYYWLTMGFEVPSPDTAPSGDGAAQGELEASATAVATEAHGWALVAIGIFTKFVACYIGIFMYLTWANRTPNETLMANLIVILPVALGIALVSYVPFVGFIFVAMILFKLYDFEWFDLVRLPLSLLVGNIFGSFLYILLSGLLGLTL